MAERIAATTCWPEDARTKRAALEAMLKPLVERAVRMCREAREAGLRSDEAAEKFVSAELEGGYWLRPLKDASDYWAVESARRLIEAYAAAEEALGAERAVGFATRGEAWRLFDLQEEAEVLFFGAARR
jgi:Arc/MetJ family transcription regulator